MQSHKQHYYYQPLTRSLIFAPNKYITGWYCLYAPTCHYHMDTHIHALMTESKFIVWTLSVTFIHIFTSMKMTLVSLSFQIRLLFIFKYSCILTLNTQIIMDTDFIHWRIFFNYFCFYLVAGAIQGGWRGSSPPSILRNMWLLKWPQKLS